MSAEISFDESKFKIRSRAILGTPEVPSIIKFLVVRKIVKTENQAVAVILTMVVILMCVSVYMIKKSTDVSPAIVDPSLIQRN